MQRSITVLAAVLGLQMAAALALKLRPDSLTPAVPDVALVGADLKDADRLLIEGPTGGDGPTGDKPGAAAPAQVELRLHAGHWQLPAMHDAPADPAKVHDLLTRLAALRRGLAVATTADAENRFKVGSSDFERRLVVDAGARTLVTLYLGNSAGPRKSSARTATDRAVYDVALSAYDLPTTAGDWFDHGLLQRDAAKIAALSVFRPGQPTLTLRRMAGAASAPAAASGWTAEGLPAGEKLDPDRARALVAQIATLHVDGVSGATSGGRLATPAGPPLLALRIDDPAGHAQTWQLWQPKAGGDATLEASGRPWPLVLKSWTVDPLLEALKPQTLAQTATVLAPTAAASASRLVSAAPKRS